MKLELKHLASYLPYKLKVYHKTFNEHSKITKSIIEELTTISYECASFANSMDYYFEDIEDNECDIKPILFPLSSLTEEITVNGETFVPIEWFEIGDSTNDSLEYDHGNIKLIRSLESLSKNEFVNDINYFPFGVIQKLIEWKIDVFGLIEAGLAEPVTEDFNPYK